MKKKVDKWIFEGRLKPDIDGGETVEKRMRKGK